MTKAVTVLRTTLKEMGKNWPWNCWLIVLKMIEVILTRPLTTNFKLTTRAHCAVSVCSPSPHYLVHWLSVAGGSLWTSVWPPLPPAQLLASETKQTLLSTILLSLLALEWQAAGPHFRRKNETVLPELCVVKYHDLLHRVCIMKIQVQEFV